MTKPTPIRQENLLIKSFVGFEVLSAVVMMASVFWDTSTCIPLKVNHIFGGTCCFHLQGQRIRQARNEHESGTMQSCSACLTYSSTLKMQAIVSSEMSVDFQRTTRRYIPEN
jgi:hypothetical protein